MHLVNSPSLGQPTPGVVKQDKSFRGSVDTTKTRSGPQRVRMCSGQQAPPKANNLIPRPCANPPPLSSTTPPPPLFYYTPPPSLLLHPPPPLFYYTPAPSLLLHPCPCSPLPLAHGLRRQTRLPHAPRRPVAAPREHARDPRGGPLCHRVRRRGPPPDRPGPHVVPRHPGVPAGGARAPPARHGVAAGEPPPPSGR